MSEYDIPRPEQHHDTNLQAEQFLEAQTLLLAAEVARLIGKPEQVSEITTALKAADVPFAELGVNLQELILNTLRTLPTILSPSDRRYDRLFDAGEFNTEWLELTQKGASVTQQLRQAIGATRANVFVAIHDADNPIPRIQEDFVIALAELLLNVGATLPKELEFQLTEGNKERIKADQELFRFDEGVLQRSLQAMHDLVEADRQELEQTGAHPKLVNKIIDGRAGRVTEAAAHVQATNAQLPEEVRELCSKYPSMRELCKKLITTW